jgi:hypothetical protein
MSHFTKTTALAALVFATVLCSAVAQAGTIRAYIDGPVVIGGQVFSGGSLELTRIGQSDLVAITLDGQRVALAFRETPGAIPSVGHTHIVLERDARGLHHLVGFRVASSNLVPLRVAAVSQGLASVPSAGHARGEGVARAER